MPSYVFGVWIHSTVVIGVNLGWEIHLKLSTVDITPATSQKLIPLRKEDTPSTQEVDFPREIHQGWARKSELQDIRGKKISKSCQEKKKNIIRTQELEIMELLETKYL